MTAQRRSEVLENVPMAVQVVTPQALQKANIDNVMELGRITPGLQFNYSGSIQGIALHGITTQVAGFNYESNVAIYVDGFYTPYMTTFTGDLAHIANIQVLKGPQGTLYGRNATGGALLISTLGPSKVFTGQFDASYGRFNEASVNGFVAGPVNDRVRFSLAGHHRRSDGYVKYADPAVIGGAFGHAAPIRQSSVRGKLEVDVSDNLTATLGLNYSRSQEFSAAYQTYLTHVSAALPPPPSRPVRLGTIGESVPTHQHTSEKGVTLKLAYNTPIGTLTSYTGYAHRTQAQTTDADGTYADISYNVTSYGQDTYQQALDYEITAIKNLDLIIGANYYNDVIKTTPSLFIYSAGRLTTQATLDQKTKSWSVYADGTYHLTDRLSLNAGGRFTHDKREASVITTSGTGAVLVPLAKDSTTWTRFTPRATIRYEVAPRTSVYASFTKGFRSGLYNGQGPIPGLPFKPAAPEGIKAYEVGFKMARSNLSFQSSAFYYDYKNLQISVLIPDPLCTVQPCASRSIINNAPGAKIYGWDNELTFRPTEALTLRAAAAVLHARFKSFTNASGTGVNATNTTNISNQIQDWTGLRMPRAPDFTGNLGADYKVPTNFGSLLFSSNLTYTSTYPIANPSVYGPLAPAGLQRKQRFLQKNLALLSAQVTWTSLSEKYWVTVYGNNITNKFYRLAYNGSAFGDFSSRAEPVTYGVKGGVKF